ncbi:MAG: shikimate kinase [Candidatus Thermoplasmatota archaeon]
MAEGSAYGAVTILNGTATGIGCSLAIEGGVQASVRPSAVNSFTASPPCDDAVARACVAQSPPRGALEIHTRSRFPPSRGLKTSSSSAAALLRALDAASGEQSDNATIIRRGVAACRAAGVTLTGAWDDQAAVVLGGCQVADSRSGRILTSLEVPRWQVAIWVPDHAIPKSQAACADVSPLAARLAVLASDLTADSIPSALTENGRLFTKLYAAAGLPVSDAPAKVALAAGALGAGLSGTGPAVAALFERRTPLEPVAGGVWEWSDVVRAP